MTITETTETTETTDAAHPAAMPDLPPGWEWTTIGEIVDTSRRRANPQENPDLEFIGLEHVEAHTMRLLGSVEASVMKSSAESFNAGDVLYGRLRPYLNKVYRPDFTGLCSPEFIVFRRSDYLDSKYLQYFLNAWDFVTFATHLNEGDRPRVDFDQLAPYPFPLPPLAEQRRIVAAIETQLTRLDAGVAALKTGQARLRRYKAAVLKAACEGRLVPQDPADEPASSLLQRILAERRERWTTDLRAKGKDPAKARYEEPNAPDTSDLPELPAGWCWATAEQLSGLITDGDHNPPKRVDRGIPHFTAKNVLNWQLSKNNCTYISVEDFDKTRKRYEPQQDDVIITCVGTIGRTAIVPPGLIFSADRNLAAIRVIKQFVEPKFLLFNLNTPHSQTLMQNASGSTAQPHLYLSDLRAFPLALAPLAEQQRIVAEVERRLSVVAALEATLAANLKRAERLRQSILKRAFEGKLVPQDPSDEPANVLLERIRADRQQEAGGGRQGRRGGPRKVRKAEPGAQESPALAPKSNGRRGRPRKDAAPPTERPLTAKEPMREAEQLWINGME